MATSTPRAGLIKPSGGDTALITNINENMDRVDELLGAVDCTSATRPSQPFPGMIIRESDTQNLLVWSGSSWHGISGPRVSPRRSLWRLNANRNITSQGSPPTTLIGWDEISNEGVVGSRGELGTWEYSNGTWTAKSVSGSNITVTAIVQVRLTWETNSSGIRRVYFDDAIVDQQPAISGSSTRVSFNHVFRGTSFTLGVSQNSGSTLQVERNSGSNVSSVEIFQLEGSF